MIYLAAYLVYVLTLSMGLGKVIVHFTQLRVTPNVALAAPSESSRQVRQAWQ